MSILTNKSELELEIFYMLDMFTLGFDINIEHTETIEDKSLTNIFVIDGKTSSFNNAFDNSLPPLKHKSLRKRILKVNLYDLLSKEYKKTLPWGSLTGVRPTKFARDLIESGQVKQHLIAQVLENDYRVSKGKAKLVASILKNQNCIIRNDSMMDLYVNIPICPSRCLYCSFISNELDNVRMIVDKYLDCLIKELDAVKKIVSAKPYIIRNIYVGGGTPSVLSASQLDRLLGELKFTAGEFTVECGRPDTITAEKLDVLKAHNVSRLSINPQTFCDATLKRIGRKHKNLQVLKAYTLALERDFIVNMDVIAGLPGEKLGMFKKTINTLLELSPHNITVHTLSIKNGSLLKDSNDKPAECGIEKMIDYSQKALTDAGYKPYYLYRQKNQLGGLENVGYFKNDAICVFNVDSMEETSSVLAVGAGAMSKRVFSVENRIERQDNVKFIDEYIARIDEMIERKNIFFK